MPIYKEAEARDQAFGGSQSVTVSRVVRKKEKKLKNLLGIKQNRVIVWYLG